MSDTNSSPVYNQEVIDMLTIGVQFCLLLENVSEQEKPDFIGKLLRLLPMLYFKTLCIEYHEPDENAYLQSFVSEDDYNLVAASVADLMGSDDVYLEVFTEGFQYSDTPITAFISENLADIYQEIKDLAGNFQSGNESVMTDALYVALSAFRQHWGQKLLNVMRALHACWLEIERSDEIEDF